MLNCDFILFYFCEHLPVRTGNAGAHDVAPCRLTTSTPRQHVVEAQLAGGEVSATVLAAIVVAQENVAAIQPHALLGDPVVEQEPDDPWDLNLKVDAADPVFGGRRGRASKAR